jgi:hypothetical protein
MDWCSTGKILVSEMYTIGRKFRNDGKDETALFLKE